MKIKGFLLLILLLLLEDLANCSDWTDFRNDIICTATNGKYKCKNKNQAPPPSPPPSPAPPPVKSEAEIRKEAEIKTHNLIINGIHDEVLLQVKSLPNLSKDVEFKAPYLIKRNYSHKELVNYSQKWNWNDDYDKIIKIEEKTNDNFVNQLNIAKENSVELEIQNKLTPKILKEKTKFIASIVTSNVPRKCSVVENLKKVETIFLNLCKHNEKFDTDQLKIEVKFVVDNLVTSNDTLEEAEIDELSVLVLSTNDELDKIFNRIDNEVREKLISKMKRLVISNIKAKRSYFEIMEQIDDSIQKIYSLQSVQSDINSSNDCSINENFVINKDPNVPFIILIEDIIGKLREDSDFFEFIPIHELKPDNSLVSMSEGFVNVTTLSISGVSPSKNGRYSYTLNLRYTYLKDGSIRSIPIKVTVVVCGLNDKCEEQKETVIETPKDSTNTKKTDESSASEDILKIVGEFILASVVCGAGYYVVKRIRNKKPKPNVNQTGDDYEMEGMAQGADRNNDQEETKQADLNDE